MILESRQTSAKLSDAKRRTNMAYDKENTKLVGMKLNRKTDADILEYLNSKENVQGYLKNLIRNEIKREEEKTMKRYIIKPEFIDLFGSDANAYTVLTEDDVENFAREWEKPASEIEDQLIELRKTGYTALYRFSGKPGWQELNELIRFESGVQEDYCETETDYRRAVRDGFITYDGYYTTVWADE